MDYTDLLAELKTLNGRLEALLAEVKALREAQEQPWPDIPIQPVDWTPEYGPYPAFSDWPVRVTDWEIGDRFNNTS